MLLTENTENIETPEANEARKPVKNVLDLLLGADAGVISMPYQDLEINRLSEVFGSPFVVRCRALSQTVYESLQERSVNIKGKDVDLDTGKLQALTVIEGVEAVAENDQGKLVSVGSLLKNAELAKRFKAPTPRELVSKLFLPGEIAKLYNTISSVSGFGDNSITEVKN